MDKAASDQAGTMHRTQAPASQPHPEANAGGSVCKVVCEHWAWSRPCRVTSGGDKLLPLQRQENQGPSAPFPTSTQAWPRCILSLCGLVPHPQELPISGRPLAMRVRTGRTQSHGPNSQIPNSPQPTTPWGSPVPEFPYRASLSSLEEMPPISGVTPEY